MELCSDSTSTLETLAESVPDVSEDTEEGFWSGTVLESFIRLSISAGDFFPCAAWCLYATVCKINELGNTLHDSTF